MNAEIQKRDNLVISLARSSRMAVAVLPLMAKLSLAADAPYSFPSLPDKDPIVPNISASNALTELKLPTLTNYVEIKAENVLPAHFSGLSASNLNYSLKEVDFAKLDLTAWQEKTKNETLLTLMPGASVQEVQLVRAESICSFFAPSIGVLMVDAVNTNSLTSERSREIMRGLSSTNIQEGAALTFDQAQGLREHIAGILSGKYDNEEAWWRSQIFFSQYAEMIKREDRVMQERLLDLAQKEERIAAISGNFNMRQASLARAKAQIENQKVPQPPKAEPVFAVPQIREEAASGKATIGGGPVAPF